MTADDTADLRYDEPLPEDDAVAASTRLDWRMPPERDEMPEQPPTDRRLELKTKPRLSFIHG